MYASAFKPQHELKNDWWAHFLSHHEAGSACFNPVKCVGLIVNSLCMREGTDPRTVYLLCGHNIALRPLQCENFLYNVIPARHPSNDPVNGTTMYLCDSVYFSPTRRQSSSSAKCIGYCDSQSPQLYSVYSALLLHSIICLITDPKRDAVCGILLGTVQN